MLFTVAGDPAVVLRRLFPPSADGYLRFGPAGVSAEPVGGPSALAGGLEFRDYALEGFVRYRLRVVAAPAGLHIEVEPAEGTAGTARGQTITWLVRFNVASGGLTAVEAPTEKSTRAEPDAAPDQGRT